MIEYIEIKNNFVVRVFLSENRNFPTFIVENKNNLKLGDIFDIQYIYINKDLLSSFLYQLKVFVDSKLSKKYSLTSSYTKELDSLVADVEKYLVDSTASTPTLDLYSDMNSRSRAEEVEAVVRMQKFLQKSGNYQMVSQKAIDRTTTKEQFSVVAKSLSRFKNISTKQEFLDIVDAEIEVMKNV